MNLNEIVVTEITEVFNLYLTKGNKSKVINRNTYGLAYSTEGQLTYTLNGENYSLDNNSVIVLPQGQNYTLKCNKSGTFSVINFSSNDVLCDTFLFFPSYSSASFMKDFEKIKELILFPENRTKILSIFYNMIHNLTFNSSVCQTIAPAIKYVEKNYSNNDISNKALADICNISEVYLRKLFLKHLKLTPKQYITEIRISKAKQLLSDGNIKIKAVSEECGFDSSYNFTRFFKNKTGITPTEYLKQNKIYGI